MTPLILTAAFDPPAAAAFQRLRDRHFPPALNIVPAHLTLFHHLPGAEEPAIAQALVAAAKQGGTMPFRTAGLRFLGRGVAVEIEVPALVALRRGLAGAWQAWLTPQDRQAFRPHVTVQNKVAPAEARALRDALAAHPPSLEGSIVGLDLWFYRGGPWDHAGHTSFSNGSS